MDLFWNFEKKENKKKDCALYRYIHLYLSLKKRKIFLTLLSFFLFHIKMKSIKYPVYKDRTKRYAVYVLFEVITYIKKKKK